MSNLFRWTGNLAFLLARLAICFWVGGAILFVITSVAEQSHPRFDSVIRDQLAAIRFPYYYMFAWICLGTTLVSTATAIVFHRGTLRKRLIAVFLLTLLSASVAVADHRWIYLPLQELITPPGQARTQEFVTLHNNSRRINELHLTVALIAAILISLPEKPSPSPDAPARPIARF